MDGWRVGEEGRTFVPQHQNKNGKMILLRFEQDGQCSQAERPRLGGVFWFRIRADFRGESAATGESNILPIVFLNFLFLTHASQKGKARFITRTITHTEHSPQLPKELLITGPRLNETDMKSCTDLAHTGDIKAIRIGRGFSLFCSVCSTQVAFHGSSAMCCSHGDSKWHVGLARNTGAPPYWITDHAQTLAMSPRRCFVSRSVMSSSIK